MVLAAAGGHHDDSLHQAATEVAEKLPKIPRSDGLITAAGKGMDVREFLIGQTDD